MADPTNPVEPEVQDRIPLEPEQLAQALNNCAVGQKVERILAFRSEKDGRERYCVVLENGAALLFAPAPNGMGIVMTIIKDINTKPQ